MSRKRKKLTLNFFTGEKSNDCKVFKLKIIQFAAPNPKIPIDKSDLFYILEKPIERVIPILSL